MTLVINIIGAGRLGQTLGHLFVKNQLVKVGAVCNRSKVSTENAIKFIGQGKYCATIAELPPADLTLITTADDCIEANAEMLSHNLYLKKGSIVFHCSGSLTSEVLASVQKQGVFIASIHPMRSFAKPELSIMQYDGTYCAIEGDKAALPKICSLFHSIGSITYKVDKRDKSSYHAAGVFASNYLVTLTEQALSCMEKAGVENDIAMRIITNIMRDTVSNLEKTLSPVRSLTGPIKRGDSLTIQKHVESFTENQQRTLYRLLGKATLELTAHGSIKKEEIMTALTIKGDECI